MDWLPRLNARGALSAGGIWLEGVNDPPELVQADSSTPPSPPTNSKPPYRYDLGISLGSFPFPFLTWTLSVYPSVCLSLSFFYTSPILPLLSLFSLYPLFSLSFNISLSLTLSVYPCVCLSLSLFILLPFYPFSLSSLSIPYSLCLSVSLSLCLSVRLSVSLSTLNLTLCVYLIYFFYPYHTYTIHM